MLHNDISTTWKYHCQQHQIKHKYAELKYALCIAALIYRRTYLNKTISSLDGSKKCCWHVNAHHYEWGNDKWNRKGNLLMDAINSSKFMIAIQMNKKATSIDNSLCSTSELFCDIQQRVLDFSIGSHHMAIKSTLRSKYVPKNEYIYIKYKICEAMSTRNPEIQCRLLQVQQEEELKST